jgi:hypothetical protein
MLATMSMMGLLDAVSEASVPRTSERSRRGARRIVNIPEFRPGVNL